MTNAMTKDHSTSAAAFLARQHRLFIGGKWTAGDGPQIKVENPATEEIVAELNSASEAQIDEAVSAAKAALAGPLGAMSAADRGHCLFCLAELIDKNAEELAEIEVAENGIPFQLAVSVLRNFCVSLVRYYAGWPTKITGATLPGTPMAPTDTEWLTYTLREPVGVVGAIIPWNAPSPMFLLKLAPTLAAGCSLVIKPAELTPLTAIRLTELCESADFPAGSINLVQGDGAVGQAMVRHTGIAKISFTGSTDVGREIVRAASDDLKRVTLELGGKSPVIIYPDADLAEAIPGAAMACFFMAGQNCMAGTRLFVEETIHDAFVEGLVQFSSGLPVGNGMDPSSLIGPLISYSQRARVQGFCDAAVQAGATLVCGGQARGGDGYFFHPTVFTDVSPDMDIVRKEVFGPVLTVQKFRMDDQGAMLDAVNDTPYGLSGSVWTRDLATAHSVARRVDSGQISINSHAPIAPETPFGGNKQSGWGREFGAEGLDAYLKTKAITVKLGPRK